MIFKIIKWSAIIKLAMVVKPYVRTGLTTFAVLWFVDLVHQELINFLKDTNQLELISYAYFTKWTLFICIALIGFYYVKKVSKRLELKAGKVPVDSAVLSKHRDLLTKDKLMSKGDQILKK